MFWIQDVKIVFILLIKLIEQMNLHSLVQCRLVFGSLLHTLCPFLFFQSHSLCHTSVTPPAPLCSCFKHSPIVFLLPFPCCHVPVLPPWAASWAGGRDFHGFGLLTWGCASAVMPWLLESKECLHTVPSYFYILWECPVLCASA